MAQNLFEAFSGDFQFLPWRSLALLPVRVQNVNVIRRQHYVEETVAASRRANLDLPELAFDLPELAAFRVQAILLNIRKQQPG
jgi:hypothetical protein